jgi:hypothetical protein
MDGTFAGVKARLVAAGIALDGAYFEVPAEGGGWRRYCEVPESTIKSIVLPWVQDGRLDVRVRLRDGEALTVSENGDGHRVTIGEGCVIGNDFLIPTGNASNPQIVSGVDWYHKAVSEGRDSLRGLVGFALREVILSDGHVNTAFVFNREWIPLGRGLSIAAFRQVDEVFDAEDVPLPALKSYIEQVASKAHTLGVPSE